MEKLFETQEALALFLIFFIPGFITLKVYDLLIPGEQRDFSKSLFDAVAYSSLNFAALLWLIALVRSGSLSLWQWYVAMFFLLIGVPALWPLVFLQIRKHPMVAQRIASPNARVWDDIFAKRTPYWVIVHLKDQRRIGGLYGGKSYTSHSPAPPESFLKRYGAWMRMAGSRVRWSSRLRAFSSWGVRFWHWNSFDIIN
jgi:Family of unknown function (DUF6338)